MKTQTPTTQLTSRIAINENFAGTSVPGRVTLKDSLKLKVQETLDQLFSKALLPFRLTAYDVKNLESGEYMVPFHDSRIRSITFSTKLGASFQDVVRAAILQRVEELDGPFEAMRVASGRGVC